MKNSPNLMFFMIWIFAAQAPSFSLSTHDPGEPHQDRAATATQECCMWSQQRNLPSGPDRPPLNPSASPSQSWTLLVAMMNDSSSQQKELTHRCISAPYFQSGQELNGFTDSPAFWPATTTFLFCCWICKRKKYSIEMHCCTWSRSHKGIFISPGCS